jgi:hypothetical protein
MAIGVGRSGDTGQQSEREQRVNQGSFKHHDAFLFGMFST